MNDKPNYYAVIPADVRYSDIIDGAKLLYGEITALASKEGYCWASNAYFAELYRVHVSTIIIWINELRTHGFISSSLEKNSLRKIYLTPSGKHDGGVAKTRGGVSGKHDTSITVTTTNNSVVAEAPTIDVPIGKEDRPTKTTKAKYPHSKEVFSWFPEPERSWSANTTELKMGEFLFERGEEDVKKAIRYCVKNLDKDGFPISRLSPYLLETNWPRIAEYAKRK